MSEQSPTQNSDLGLGDKVIQENETRLVNLDGTFNVSRKGVFNHGAFSPYHAILKASWPVFYLYIIAYLLGVVFLFTLLYLACGVYAFSGLEHLSLMQRFTQLLFFSTQVLAAGASPIYPVSVSAEIAQGVESVVGLLGFALAAGLVFARFSNPRPKIVFSNRAVIAPYKEITAFMLRIINGRSNELIYVSASLVLSLLDKNGIRRFHKLRLERDQVESFAINWTIVHPIDEESPLFGLSESDLLRAKPEIVVTITATDEDLSKQVYVRRSYVTSEIAFGRKFAFILERDSKGNVVVDPNRIHEIETV